MIYSRLLKKFHVLKEKFKFVLQLRYVISTVWLFINESSTVNAMYGIFVITAHKSWNLSQPLQYGRIFLPLWVAILMGFYFTDSKQCGILGDPGADSGCEGKSKQAEKYGTKEK